MKRILGLDLGTNSIGWALIEIDHKNGIVKILGLGSRILPMDAGEIGEFESKGKIESSAAARTAKRGPRRMNERYMLRRDRLHLVLDLLDALPAHYKLEIDFERNGQKCGQFMLNKEPKVAYVPLAANPKKKHFIFESAYEAMLRDIKIPNVKGSRIPRDWTLYYLRQKALTEEITLEELAWVLLSYNQKRGYEKLDVEDKSVKSDEIHEELDLQVKSVYPKTDGNGKRYYEIKLAGNDGFVYREFTDKQMTFENDLKEIVKISKVDEQGNIDPKKTEFKVVDIYPLTITQVAHQNEKGKHIYTLTYDNGWTEQKESKKYTFKYRDATGKPFDYVVEAVYDAAGNLLKVRGRDKTLREPDFSDKSNDWTLFKKRTEKEALKFNMEQGYLNEDGSTKSYISPKIYSVLRSDAKSGVRTKIIGGLFQVVERKFYREELKQIISTQRVFHAKLNNAAIFDKCVKVLYPKNESHAKSLLGNKHAIEHLLVDDILLYQRPLKSKKSEISDCKYEIKYWQEVVDKKTGEISKEPVYLKAVSASHPYFQEFRIWDKLHNLRLIQIDGKTNGELSTNVDVTKTYFDQKAYQELFADLNNRKTLTQKQFLAFCKSTFKIKDIEKNYVWNFPEDEELKGNETRVNFATRFRRCGFVQYADFLTQEKELELWHYLYSVNYKDRKENDNQSLTTFFDRFLSESGVSVDVKSRIIEDFSNYPKFASNYCAYSEKALKKLLPFLRMGEDRFTGKFNISEFATELNDVSYDRANIDALINPENKETLSKEAKMDLEIKKQNLHDALWKHTVNERVDEIIKRLNKIDFEAEKIDDSVAIANREGLKRGELPYPKGLFNAFRGYGKSDDFTSLDLTRASYLVYGRHSELAQAKYWTSPDIIREELHKELKQHSLNNPVAEKVILEMMQVVAQIWDHYGVSSEKFFDAIHVEVGRELKKSAKQKTAISSSQSENRKQNHRLRKILEEFLSTSPYKAQPKNSEHFDRLKIVEDAARVQLNDKDHLKDKTYSKKEIEEILNKPRFERADFEKYKLWIEQGYRSPYTGKTISLTNLFDRAKYNIDHVFPQASVTNDSLNNKVVCETEVNKLKSNQTGRAFVNNPKLRELKCLAYGEAVSVKIVEDAEYVDIVRSQFSGQKKHILLSKEIPKEFTNSQLNNARHIARKAMELLSHIVREEGEVEFLSKNVLPVTGAVTGKLKEAWRLDEVWKELVAPRYKRMNELTNSQLFGSEQKSKAGHKYFDCKLDEAIREKDESYDIKRIDHRHHALDALIVALCTRDHVNYINNINSDVTSNDFGKQKQLEAYRSKLKRKIKFTRKEGEQDEKNWHYMLPGNIRRQDAESFAEDTVMTKSYQYKDLTPLQGDYKKMVLTALQHTVVTFKQNLRVINKTVNRYNKTPDKKEFAVQENGKYNWAIRRSLGKDTFYGKQEIEGEPKIISRKMLDSSFERKKILTITDSVVQSILFNHLKQYDTLELPFEEAIVYFNALVEKSEFESLVQNVENSLSSITALFDHLKSNSYKFDKVDYSSVNVFIDQVAERDFRNEESFKNKIEEHPEIAFSAEMIDKMNQPEELLRLNSGKSHMPIRKVKVASGFGKQRKVSENKDSVKTSQYVVTDAGSNLYLGFYERRYIDEIGNEVRERQYKDIGLIDLIETLKQDKDNRYNPLPDKIYDDKKNEYERIFTLSPLDMVYVPTKDEIENPTSVDAVNMKSSQLGRIYKYVDGGGGIANFVPYEISKPLWRFHKEKEKKDIHAKLSREGKLDLDETELIKDEFGFGSQQTKNQNMSDGKTQIKRICWKLEVDKLGNITKVIR